LTGTTTATGTKASTSSRSNVVDFLYATRTLDAYNYEGDGDTCVDESDGSFE